MKGSKTTLDAIDFHFMNKNNTGTFFYVSQKKQSHRSGGLKQREGQ